MSKSQTIFYSKKKNNNNLINHCKHEGLEILSVSILLEKKSSVVHLSTSASSSLRIPHRGLGTAFIRWISNLACRQIQWNKQSYPKPTGYISKQHMTNKPVKAFPNLCGSKDTVAFDSSYREIMNYMSTFTKQDSDGVMFPQVAFVWKGGVHLGIFY